MSRAVIIALLLVLAGLALPPLLDADTGQRPSNGLREAHYTTEGIATCMRCHSSERMSSMADSPHGNKDNPHTPFAQQGCEACHGPGSVHASRAGGGRGFPPLTTFAADEDREPQLSACLHCHAKPLGELEPIAWRGGLHDMAGLNCVECHRSHLLAEELAAERTARTSACGACHRKQLADHDRFADPGQAVADLACADCHDVHQQAPQPAGGTLEGVTVPSSSSSD